jgi:hypothetical protein
MADQIEIDSERSRIRNALVNAGACTFLEAERRLEASRLRIQVSDVAADTVAGQAAVLTAAVTAVRCFGNVAVSGALDRDLLVPIPLRGRSLGAAVAELGARIDAADATDARTVAIGPSQVAGWSVQAYWDGWIVGVAPAGTQVATGRGDCPLAGIASAGIAVGQAFLAEQGDVRAGRAGQRLSLWEPDAPQPAAGPPLGECSFPLQLWLVGLGNLGQAYLWSLATLPFRRSGDVLLFLQDDDTIKKENWGTSVLAERGRYGVLKARIAEEWAERRGFRVRRVDRRLDEHLRRTDLEPAMALAGLDRMPPRCLLGAPGFEYVIDAGLGAMVADYRCIRVSTFGPGEDPAQRFAGVDDHTDENIAELRKLPAYQEIETASEHGRCGAATLAGQAVVVPFVSAVAGALVVAQAVRVASGEAFHSTLTADVGDLRTVRAARGNAAARLALKIDSPPA